MRILVIEDEPLVAAGMVRDLRKLQPHAEILGPLGSVREIREWMLHHAMPDLIISDIQLSDGVSFDALSELKSSCPIIFTTAFDEYALRAFRLFSIDYLLKPIDTDDLKLALEKFQEVMSKYKNQEYWDEVRHLMLHKPALKMYKERFTVHQGTKVVLVPANEVVGFVKQEVIFLIDKAGERYVTDYRSLDEIEEMLDPRQFFRVNRQTLLQLTFIKAYKTHSTGKLEVYLAAAQLPPIWVSKEKASEFRSWLADG
jgi:two-component system LytT family response regulator